MNKNQWIAVIAAVITASVILIAAVSLSDGGEERKTLIVETNYDSAPFDYLVGDDLVGIDADILRAVCDEMGYDLEFRYKTFDSIIDSVQAGNCDIGANAFTINDERKELVLFSDPYITVEQAAVIPADSDIRSAADIKGMRITVKNGTTCADCAETLSDDIVYKKTYLETVQDLLSGNADCGFANNLSGASQVSKYPGKLKLLDDDLGFPSEDFGFVFSKDNAELRDAFNASLETIMENGLYRDILDYYAQNGYADDTPSFFSDSVLVVGIQDSKPFNYPYGDGYSGIDIDILADIHGRLGTHGLIKKVDGFDQMLNGVADGSFDIGASSITVTDDRKDRFLFSVPYMDVRQVLVAKLDASYSAEDLAGLTLATQSATTSLDIARDHSSRILEFDSYDGSLAAVLDGRADCEVVDSIAARSHVLSNPGLKVLDVLDCSESFAFVFSKDNADLHDRVDAAMNKMKESGDLDDILDYYLKQDYGEVESYFDSDRVLRIGAFPVVTPFNYYLDGNMTGIDMDLVRVATDYLGMGRHIIEAGSFTEILDGVIDGKYDMGVSEISITEERKETLLFSDPYADVRQVLVVKAGSGYTLEDLPGLTIASQTASTSLDVAKEHSANVLEFNSYGEALGALLDGRAQCEVTDNYVAMSQVTRNPGLEILDILDHPEQFAFVFSKDNQELCDRVNAVLEIMKNNGIRDEIFGYYERNGYNEVESYFDSDAVVSIVSFFDLVPFDYILNDRPAGIDMDILTAVCREMDVSMIIYGSETFDGVLDGVMYNDMDIGSSGVTVTDDRKNRFLFSEPYMQIRQIVLAEAGSDYTAADLKDLVLATHYNTTSLDVAKDLSDGVLVYPSYADAVKAMLEGDADCVVVDNITAETLMGDNPGLVELDILGVTEDFAFVFSEDDTEMRDAVNAAMAKLKADGTIGAIISYYESNGYLAVKSYFA